MEQPAESPDHLATPDLVIACQLEQRQSSAGDNQATNYRFELFRRAVCERDDQAWEGLFDLYGPLILARVRRHPCYTHAKEDNMYWLNRAFQRFFLAVGPDRFAGFHDLFGLIRYLITCAETVLMDESRRIRRAKTRSLDPTSDESLVEESPESPIDPNELWTAIAEALSDECELLVARLSFVVGLTPREILIKCPDRFQTIKDVYRIKRNMIDRLRRSARVRELLGLTSPA